MHQETRNRVQILQKRMLETDIRRAVFTDESSIGYLTGIGGYLGIEFGRPTMLVIDSENPPSVITPLMESEMVGAMTWVDDIRVWEDIGRRNWGRVLGEVLGDSPSEIWIERNHLPAIVRNYLEENYPDVQLSDISPVLAPYAL